MHTSRCVPDPHLQSHNLPSAETCAEKARGYRIKEVVRRDSCHCSARRLRHAPTGLP